MENGGGFMIAQKSKANKKLFLVDRDKIKDSWRTEDKNCAIIFNSKKVAERNLGRIKLGKPFLVDLNK